MKNSRVALVTGGGGGIGRAICTGLAQTGHRVAVADKVVERAREAARDAGGLAVEMDVANPASITEAVAQVVVELGPVEVCVNCAGWDELKPFLDTDDAFLQKVLEINLAGPMRVVRSVLPSMVERRWGRLIHIASDAGRVGSSLEAIYSGAKGGLIAFSKTIAREMARYEITSNSVCPGPTQTPLLDGIVDASANGQKTIDAMVRAVPMRRLGEPDDIASAVVYLASERAGFVTGQTLSVSGGLTMV